VLLLDEPLGALDLKLRKQMQLELKDLQDRVGITFIYVTHDQEEALTMSDRIAVMDRGHVLQVGGPAEIYEQPNSRFVANFIGETNFLDGQVMAAGDGRVTVKVHDGLTIQAPNATGLQDDAAVTVAIRPEKIRLWRDPPPQTQDCLLGRIEEVVYFGTDTNFLVSLAGELSIRVRQQNSISSRDWMPYVGQRGDQVYMTWPLESVLLLRE
jgi:spermidine/putrescine transport system ATP-binding protein